MSHRIEIAERVKEAERIASQNGGYLPTMSKLWDAKEIGIIRAIRADRAPFEHILPKMGRGRDKTKYAYVQAHMDEDDDVLAKDLDVSKTTIRNWKTEIREAGFRSYEPDDAPDDVTIDDVAKFVVKNLPEGWELDTTYGRDGCFVTLRQPNGMRRDVDDAYGASLVQSVLAHVNYARAKSGMPPVGWSL
jgi:hypothetical protein